MNQNASQLFSAEIEEVLNLHHLLEGYNSILYRYHGNPHLKNQNWNYDSQSDIGRPDRHRAKYSEDEAIEQMKNVDAIFPIYGKYFNTSDVERNESFVSVLAERIRNIEEVLICVREEVTGNSSARMKIKWPIWVSCFVLIFGIHLFE